MEVNKRYSELLSFVDALKPHVASLDSLPAGYDSVPVFPGKVLGRMSEQAKQRRQEGLEVYLCFLVKITNAHNPNDSGRSIGGGANDSDGYISESLKQFLNVTDTLAPSLPSQQANDPHKYLLERQNKLMDATSYVSEGLIRIYFLDCTFRTVKITPQTTMGDVSGKLSPFMNIAIFEVSSDVRIPSHLSLLSVDTVLSTVVQQWKENDMVRAKFLMPVENLDGQRVPIVERSMQHSSNSPAGNRPGSSNSTTGNRPTTHSWSSHRSTAVSFNAPSPSVGSPSLIGSPSNPSSHTEPSFLENSMTANLSMLTHHSGATSNGGKRGSDDMAACDHAQAQELKELKDAYEKLNVKYNTLRNVIKKKGREKIRLPVRDTSKTIRGESGDYEPRADTAVSFATEVGAAGESPSTRMEAKTTIVLCGWLNKLSDFKKVWNKRYFVLKSSGDLIYYYTEPRSGTKPSDARLLCNLEDVVKIVRSSTLNGFCVVTQNSRCLLSANTSAVFNDWFNGIQGFRTMQLQGIEAEALAEAGLGDQTSFGETSEKEEEPDEETNLLLTMEPFESGEGHKKITAKQFVLNVAMVDDFFSKFDRSYMTQAFSAAVMSPDHLSQACEVVSVMQVLYTNSLGLGERWTHMYRMWMLTSLKSQISLPVQRPDILMAIVNSLGREQMLESPETIATVENAIEACLQQHEDDGMSDDETEVQQLLRHTKGIINCLFMVVDDLVPMLPSNFNVLSLFQKKAEDRIQRKVCVFYGKNKELLDVDDVLSLLSWANNHKHVMERFGVFAMSKEFVGIEKDLFEKYSKQVELLQLEWQDRIMYNPKSHDVNSIHDGSKVTSWPEDLIGCISMQLQITVNRLAGDNVDEICCLCVKLLRNFYQKILKAFVTDEKTMMVERMCAYANDCFRFCDLLQAQTSILDTLTDVAADKVLDTISDCVQMYTSLCSKAVDAVVDVMCCDIEEELLSNLFTDIPTGGDSLANVTGSGDIGSSAGTAAAMAHNGEGLAVISTMMAEFTAEIRSNLSDNSLVAMVLKNSLTRLIRFYLESLLKASPKMDLAGEVMKQIRDDSAVLSNCFSYYDDYIPSVVIERALEPLKQIILLCDMDVEGVVDYWMSKLVKTFGSSSTLVVESVLVMRNDRVEVKKSILEQVKVLLKTHGSAIIHDEKCFMWLDLKSKRVRKRDLLINAVNTTIERRKAGQGSARNIGKMFVIKRTSSAGSKGAGGKTGGVSRTASAGSSTSAFTDSGRSQDNYIAEEEVAAVELGEDNEDSRELEAIDVDGQLIGEDSDDDETNLGLPGAPKERNTGFGFDTV